MSLAKRTVGDLTHQLGEARVANQALRAELERAREALATRSIGIAGGGPSVRPWSPALQRVVQRALDQKGHR